MNQCTMYQGRTLAFFMKIEGNVFLADIFSNQTKFLVHGNLTLVFKQVKNLKKEIYQKKREKCYLLSCNLCCIVYKTLVVTFFNCINFQFS